MTEIGIAQRVPLIDGGLTEYKEIGTVVVAGTSRSWHVQLDGETHADASAFFHGKELQALVFGATRRNQPRRGRVEVRS